MATDILNIMIGGQAGQGLATVGQVLAKSLVRGGWEIVVTQSYLSRIRGGHNTMAIRAACRKIQAPGDKIDLLIALDQQTVDMHLSDLAAGGLIITGEGMAPDCTCCLRAPFDQLAPGPFANVAAAGAAVRLLGLDRELAAGVLEKMFGKKGPKMVRKNRQALDAAYDWAGDQEHGFEPLGPPVHGTGRLMMQGNEALALGAVSAGVKFCSFYPMTPATSIALAMAALMEPMGLVVEQAEDEIAAINMAVGASYAGAPSLVPTSGGGFALMGEGLSLAGMIETPLVAAVSQRPGPATGLPTRTEQGDLELALYSGHGDFPRAVFTPGSVEQCFHLARRAVQTAEDFQTPVIILTDQFLADSFRSVQPFEVETLETVAPPVPPDAVASPYHRYALTESGVSPRLIPGLSEHLVSADSDEHTTDGRMTEDLAVRVAMQDKRMEKLQGMRAACLPPDFGGEPDSDLLLVCWGTSLGAVAEAAEILNSGGRRTGYCHFSQVWPLDPDGFLPRFEAAAEVVCVEGNGAGQFAGLIRKETGFSMGRMVLRYDGLPLTPQFIIRNIDQL